jgi:hypothetical protein
MQDAPHVEDSSITVGRLITELCTGCPGWERTRWTTWPKDQFRTPVFDAVQQTLMRVERDRVFDDDEDFWQWRAHARELECDLLDLPMTPDEDDEEPNTDLARRRNAAQAVQGGRTASAVVCGPQHQGEGRSSHEELGDGHAAHGSSHS